MRRGENLYKHGLSQTRLYKVWDGMRSRCLNPNQHSHHKYGGRGITLCEEWLNPIVFIAWAETHGYASGLQIERRDNNAGYSPDNCYFATRQQQCRNTRTNRVIELNGRSMTVTEWAEQPAVKSLGLTRDTIYARLQRKWIEQEAITTPIGALKGRRKRQRTAAI
jgi:hypothetical protein